MAKPAAKPTDAKRWLIRGRVQGVGYRYFAQRAAVELGLTGYTRNLDDGRVEVYAAGPLAKLSELAGMLYRGPRWGDVRGVEEQEAAVQEYGSFRITYPHRYRRPPVPGHGRLLLETPPHPPVRVDDRQRPRRAGPALVPHTGPGMARRPLPALGSLPGDRPAALRPGAARRRLSFELDPLSAAARKRPHRGLGSRLVLRDDSPDGGRLLLPLLPQPRAFPHRQPRRRPRLQPLRFPRQHRLAPDDERRRLDPPGLPVRVASCPRPAARRQCRSLRHVPGHRLSERPSSDTHLHLSRLDRGLDLPPRQESPPTGSRRRRAPLRRLERRHANPPRLRVRPPRQTLGQRARSHHLEPTCPVLRPRPLRPQGVQPLRYRLPWRAGAFRSLPRSGRVLAGAVRRHRPVARRPRAPAGRARCWRGPLRLGPQQRLSGSALRPHPGTRQGALAFRRHGALPVRCRRAGRLRNR